MVHFVGHTVILQLVQCLHPPTPPLPHTHLTHTHRPYTLTTQSDTPHPAVLLVASQVQSDSLPTTHHIIATTTSLIYDG